MKHSLIALGAALACAAGHAGAQDAAPSRLDDVLARGALRICTTGDYKPYSSARADGRFEGIDERVIAGRALQEVSIGDYVLSGGEIAAMALIDACVRLLPGVMGTAASGAEESFTDGLLEYPHYTRPQLWEGRPIPEILLSGDHAKIAAWRRAEAERLTKERRPDLWAAFLSRNRGGSRTG